MSGDTVADALDSLYTPYGMTVTAYKDKACTQVLDGTMTVDEFFALDTVYCVATAEEGNVIYTTIREEKFGADTTDAYKMVFNNWLYDSEDISTANVSNGIYLYMPSDGVTVITVNGVVVEFAEGEYSKDYAVTEGQTYVVKKVVTYNKADLNIFDIIF